MWCLVEQPWRLREIYFSRSILGIMQTRFGPGNVARRLDRHDTASIRSQRMSRTIKAKRYSTLAACVRRSLFTPEAKDLGGSTARPSTRPIRPRRSPTCSPAGRRGASSDGGSRPAVRSRPRVSDRRRSGGAAQCCRGCWTRRVQPALGRTVLPARKADVRSSVDMDARWRKRLTATPAYQILSALGADSAPADTVTTVAARRRSSQSPRGVRPSG